MSNEDRSMRGGQPDNVEHHVVPGVQPTPEDQDPEHLVAELREEDVAGLDQQPFGEEG